MAKGVILMKKTKTIFNWMIAFFVFIVLEITLFNEFFVQKFISIPGPNEPIRIPLFLIPMAIFLVLGGMLICSVKKEGIGGKKRLYLLLAGWSAVGIPIAVILHNVVYGLGIYFFGEGIWGEGGDEGLFFILGVIILPLLYVYSAYKSWRLIR